MTDGVSFGKGRSVDFSGFNGIKKSDINAPNEKKRIIWNAVIKKYDANEDGILDKDELAKMKGDIEEAAKGGKAGQLGKKEAKNYIKSNLGLNQEQCSREELLELLEIINRDEDSVADAVTDRGGTTTVKYKQDPQGNDMTEEYKDKQLTKRVISNNQAKTTISYKGGAKTKEVYEKQGEWPVTIEYEGGPSRETEISRYRQQGAVTEYLDANNKVKTKITDKGSGIIERIAYDIPLNRRGGVADFTYVNDVLMRKIVKNGEDVVTTDYSYTDNEVIEITTEGDKKTKTVRAKEGREIYGRFEIDEEGNPKPYEHKVDKENDTWYGIVQAKYGQTDHKVIMEIVHQLKDNAKVAYSAKTIPDKITLPPTITLKSGATVELKDIAAQIDETHNIPDHINVNRTSDVPTAIALTDAQKKIDMAKYEKPQSITISGDLQSIDFAAIVKKYPIDSNSAGKTVKINDNEYVEYDNEGRPTYIYDHEPDDYDDSYNMSLYYNSGKKPVAIDKYIVIDGKRFCYDYHADGLLDNVYTTSDKGHIYYKNDGTADSFKIDIHDPNNPAKLLAEYDDFGVRNFEYGKQGNKVADYEYDTSGNLIGIKRYILDDNGPERVIEYDAEGNVTGFEEKFYGQTPVSNKVERKTIKYNADGTVREVNVLKLSSDDAKIVRYDSSGNRLQE